MTRKKDDFATVLEWIIKIVFVCIAGIFVYNKKKKKRKEIEEKENRLNVLINSKLTEYHDVLVKKFKQLVYKDDYGIIKTDSFKRELRYFIKNVIEPENNIVEFNQEDLIEQVVNNMKENVNIDEVSFSSNISPYDFEKQCAQILNKCGWSARTTQKSLDQGIDVIAEKNGSSIAIQCKLYSQPVGNKAVQEANSGKSFYKTDYAAVVTNNTYTSSARQLAQNCGVFLLSYEDLADLDKIIQK
ncbi:MAG: restriction endonuclease [Alphaproteobacteria bacterium]|nr:restriction endonuclease [Alphaproteobacteria bacterium]